MTAGGPVVLRLGDVNGLSLWVDGKPVQPETETTLDLPTGRHRLTFAVDLDARQDGLRVELGQSADSPARWQAVGGK